MEEKFQDMNASLSIFYEFGDFVLYPDVRELRAKDDNRLIARMTPNSCNCLQVLLESRGELCSYEYLSYKALGVRYNGEPNIISKYISGLRKKLHDKPKLPKYIQTIPKGGGSRGGGFTFIADVTKKTKRYDNEDPLDYSGLQYPQLHLWCDYRDATYEWNNSKPDHVREIYLNFENIGDFPVSEVLPSLVIKSDDGTILHDFASEVRKKGKRWEILPKKSIRIGIFNYLVLGYFRWEIALAGLVAILDKKFTLSACCQYKVFGKQDVLETSTVELCWSWYQPDILMNEIRLRIFVETTYKEYGVT